MGTTLEAAEGDGIASADQADTQAFVRRVARLAWEKKGEEIRALRVYELVNYTDYFLVVSARSDRQVQAIWQHIDDTLRVEDKRKPRSLEGTEQNQWVILDYGELVVHVYFGPVREFYELEDLWNEAPELELDLPESDVPDAIKPATPFGY